MAISSSVATVIEGIRIILSRFTADLDTVVVCPDDGLYMRTYRKYSWILMPKDAILEGSVIHRADGTRIQFVGCTDYQAAPSRPFAVEFVGWGTDVMSDSNTIQTWMGMAAQSQ